MKLPKRLSRLGAGLAIFASCALLTGAVITGGTSGVNAEVETLSKALRITFARADGSVAFGVPTCSVATGAYTPPATPSDTAGICGSGTKVIRVFSAKLSGTATAATVSRFVLLKRSTASSPFSVTDTAVAHDSNDAACTATVGHYTANPASPGTLIGNVRSDFLLLPATGSVASQDVYEGFPDSAYIGMKPVTLRGTGQCLYFNFAGAALPAGSSWSADFTWTEE
jgi:hypothetical protein